MRCYQRASKARRTAAFIVVAGLVALVLAAVASAAVSLYRTGTVQGGVAYNSIQRPWNGDALVNQDSQNIGVARIWAQSPTAGRIIDTSGFLPAGQTLYQGYAYQQATNWCQSSNTRNGACAGYY